MDIERLARKKLIFSKRYPLIAEEVRDTLENDMPPTEEEKAGTEASLREFKRKLREDTVFMLRPERVELARELIALAKKLSKDCQVSMDIHEAACCIEITLFLYTAFYPRDMAHDIAELILTCDQMSAFIPKDMPDYFALTVRFFTHDHYLGGKRME